MHRLTVTGFTRYYDRRKFAMTINPPDALELNPAVPITASVIWLHGLGADGHDFESIVPELGIVEKYGECVLCFRMRHTCLSPVN